MKNKFLSVLSVILVIVLSTVLSLSVLAENESSNVESSAVVESSDVSNVSDVSDDASNDSSDDKSDASSKDESKATDKDESKDDHSGHNHESDSTTDKDTTPIPSDFPWARVITLIVIVVLILVAFILSKTKTKLGMKINKFFKEYWSEIKKVSWCSFKDTMKATGVVLVFVLVAAAAIGVLDFGFTKAIEFLATLFTK